MKPERDLLSTLQALRRRLTAQALAGGAARALLAALGVLVLVALLDHWWNRALWSNVSVLVVLTAPLLWAGMAALRARPSLSATARTVDRAAGTRDRFTTALEFTAEAPGEARQLAWRECAAYVRGRDFSSHLPWRWPRELPWLWVPLLALALLRWEARVSAAAREVQAASAAKTVAPTVAELQKLAQALQKGGEQARSGEVKRLAEELQRSAERLRAGAKNQGDAEKSTLRELSALEEMVRQLQEQQRTQFNADELRELARALREIPATEEAGWQLDKGELAASAASLEKKAEELAAQGDERTPEEVQKALKAALERLAQQRALSPSAQQAAQQSGAPSEAMRKLADLLRKMPSRPGSSTGQPGEPMSPQAMRKLLAALEDLKNGEGKSAQAGATRGGEKQTLMQAFDRRQADDQTGEKIMRPTGQPGGDRDQGTTDHPFAEERNPATPKGADLALSGLPGAGPTASQLLPGANSGDAKARRQYKNLYEAMAPAAEEAVQQENIPLGSRYFVKRYFESIRPQE